MVITDMRDKVVVSLSTIPPRFRNIGKILNCLLDQNFRANEIYVYIPRTYRRFPQHSFFVPEVPPGVTVKIVDQDLGPATKVLYCAKAHWGTNTRIVYCDDDRLPEKNWLNSFVKATEFNPDKAIVSTGWNLEKYGYYRVSESCLPRAVKKRVIENPKYVFRRLHQKLSEVIFRKSFQKPGRIKFKKAGYVDIAEGLGGVSIKPEFFSEEAFEIPETLWTVDDIWLSGFLEHRRVGIWAANCISVPVNSYSATVDNLHNLNYEGLSPHSTNVKLIEYMHNKFSIW